MSIDIYWSLLFIYIIDMVFGVVCFWDKYKANYPKHIHKWLIVLIVLIAGDEFSARKIYMFVYMIVYTYRIL